MISQSCHQCATTKCIPDPSGSGGDSNSSGDSGSSSDNAGAIAGGVIMSVTGAAGIVAGAVLYHRANKEREHAIDLYNQERAASCRP